MQGTVIGARYEVLREAGRGDTGVVYVASDTALGRLVALKELRAPVDPARALIHLNIAVVFDAFEHDGRPFVAMEYFERGSLRPYVLARLTTAQIGAVLDDMLA